ncbi:MAG TPA: biopolymer transporter ExbD [Vitreimonas sp.]|uniref:ExbD/TolR family protein n=1 Tax=Vitreimonas sp. TaxID=3069702 RepID=UPI002D2981F3|nr:biopolymer transporter ExbD [Vitreimonas sp.]HYD88197.1 biopolymer transporter ExbD [Vitreimonas sp.]
MAGGLAASKRRGGGRRRRAGRLAEINVTPFVDVMLVLLIVFMVTAPLLTVSIPIELPRTEAKQSAAETDPLSITIQNDGVIYLQETPVTLEELVPRLRAISNEGYDRSIYIRGDARTSWDTMAEVLASVSSAGFRKLQLVTDTDDGPRARPAAGSE